MIRFAVKHLLSRSVCAALAVALVLPVFLAPSVDFAYGANKKNKQKGKGGKKGNKSANSAKQRHEAASAALKQAGEAWKEARKEATEALRAVRQLEETLVEQQPTDSPFGKARVAYEDAKVNFRREQQRVLTQLEQSAEYQKAAGTPRLAALRKEALEKDQALNAARAYWEPARDRYDRLRNELFKNNPEWTAAQAVVTKARNKEAEHHRAIVAGAGKKMAAGKAVIAAEKQRRHREAAQRYRKNVQAARRQFQNRQQNRNRNRRGLPRQQRNRRRR